MIQPTLFISSNYYIISDCDKIIVLTSKLICKTSKVVINVRFFKLGRIFSIESRLLGIRSHESDESWNKVSKKCWDVTLRTGIFSHCSYNYCNLHLLCEPKNDDFFFPQLTEKTLWSFLTFFSELLKRTPSFITNICN